MENPEEILHSLEEFSKMKPKDIPRELEEYLCFVAKTGNPVYQWPVVKSLFREKLLNVITEFYESCPSVDIPPCPNVEMFNYDLMKNFILEKLDTFASAPFTVQRICELLTTPKKEYNRIDKYMRALEKNILVVSTTEPGRRSTENGEGIMNGIESEHMPESSNSSHDINVEEMDDPPTWPRTAQVAPILFENAENDSHSTTQIQQIPVQDSFENSSETRIDPEVPTANTCSTTQPQMQDQQETVITCRSNEDAPYVSIEPLPLNTCLTSHRETNDEHQTQSTVTITAVPAAVQQRRKSVELPEDAELVPEEIEETEDIKPTNVSEELEKAEEQTLPAVACPEIISEVAKETKVDTHSEKIPLVQEELGIENISPENSSSSPETLQINAKTEQINNETEQAMEETKELLLEEETAEDPADQMKDQELDGIPLDQVADLKNDDNKDLGGPVEESEEKPFQNKPEVKEEVETPSEKLTNDSEHKMDNEETPMEVDVVSETELKKEGETEKLSDDPADTSNTTAL
ncbi:hypothetical protein NQ318_015548 [Aromia moschata]|uniref:Serine/threonine-protein phosphatase 4 regulatory subunit 2 n=1 Tax=Aromia moschata TaxID=1265417 RepID=A0AAV8Y742_9CUCU|nr:hypothetical protein NQ318_015548 [Aromia moschata]